MHSTVTRGRFLDRSLNESDGLPARSGSDGRVCGDTDDIANALLRLVLVALLVALIVAGPPLASAQAPKSAAPPQQPQPAQIDRNGVLILVRSSLLALDQANKTGNYTVLRDIGAPGFQVANTAARLAEVFAKLRNDKVDLSGVAVIDPQLSLLPQVEANGLMHMAGVFPSVPSQVSFELMYAPVEGQWRLFGISVKIGQSGPVAPQLPEAPKRAEPAKPKGAEPAKPKGSTAPAHPPARADRPNP